VEGPLINRPHLAPLAAAALVLGGSLSIQVSAALASELFDSVGTLGVSGLRMAVAAAVLLVIFRPRLRGRSTTAWLGIVLYGVAMAAMNVLFYNALMHLPLGIAVTLEFLGPLAVAVVATRLRWEALLPVATLIGVALVSNPSGGMTWIGLAFGLGAAVAFGGYTVLAGRVGESSAGLDGLTLSVAVGAVLLAPFSIEALPRVDGQAWLILAASGLIGVALAFSLDFIAVRLTSPRLVGTLFAIDHFTPYGFGRTWPVLLIVFGVLSLMGRGGANRTSAGGAQ